VEEEGKDTVARARLSKDLIGELRRPLKRYMWLELCYGCAKYGHRLKRDLAIGTKTLRLVNRY
jgi:hypothetical protein